MDAGGLPDNHTCRVALPFCHLTLKAPKPPLSAYPCPPKTLGEHLKKKRMDLKLTPTYVAFMLKCDKTSVHNWEHSLYSPSLQYYHRIIEFLGYAPYDATKMTLGQKIRAKRWFMGISQEKLAKRLRVDPSTLGKWEKGYSRPSRRYRKKLINFLSSPL
jgi:transcriptional regulator with XRE-family HTH domain